MQTVQRDDTRTERARFSRLGLASVALLVVLSVPAALAGLWKLLVISWTAFAAMAGMIPLGSRSAEHRHPRYLVWGYGLASGAMITSAAVFLVPPALGRGSAAIGGFGLALGILAGFAGHTVGHRLTHAGLRYDSAAMELAAHALSAGAIIGLVYNTLPELGAVLGLAIVSHKAPAGYAASHRLSRAERRSSVLLVPACGVGLAALPVGLLELPDDPMLSGAVFGFAAGIFLHVAMDFLPRCEIGDEVYRAATLSTDGHARLDRLRVHAVVSTFLGGAAVLAAWLALAA